MIEQEEAMRQLIAYAHEEMRNRGLEAAARLIEQRARSDWRNGSRYADLSDQVRMLKRDPAKHLSDWYGPRFEIIHMVPIGA